MESENTEPSPYAFVTGKVRVLLALSFLLSLGLLSY